MKTLIQVNDHVKNLLRFLTICFSIVFCEATFGQAPNLGTSSSFALFTAAGAIDNTGTTTIWGDVGTFVGAYTGSPIVMGDVHVEDSVSAKVATDVSAAYSYMFGLTCDSTIISPFGDGLVLLPGKVYCLTTASALNGDLILDARGDRNGIFIIKVNGALSTSTNSNVILRDSANLCNVYWQVGGVANLGIHSTFKGTILADGAINILDSALLEGRGLSRAGAISLYNNQVFGCDASGLRLPVELISFKGQQIDATVQLNWATASETNNDYFTIQRSINAITFEDVLCIQGAGNSNSIQNYVGLDLQPFDGAIFYRLMQTDFDGTTTFSEIIYVKYEKTFPFAIFPNPFSTSTTFVMNNIQNELSSYELRIYNVMGDEMMNLSLTEQFTTIATDNLFSGIYLYKITGNGETIQSGRLISE